MSPPSHRPRALFLSPEAPELGTGGGGARSASLLAYLERGYDVDVVSLDLRPHSKTAPAKLWRNAIRLARNRPPLFDRYGGYEDQLESKIAQQIGEARYEVGVIEHFWCASYEPLLRRFCDRVVLDLHNIESQLARSHAGAARGPVGWVSERFAHAYENLEREWLPRFDALLVTSELDRRRVAGFHSTIRVFPNAIPWVPLPQVEERNVIAFSGNLEYHPNIEAVRWFRSAIWPLIAERNREVTWELIGRNPEAIAHLVKGDPRIHVTGPVPDAIEALASAKVCVVPLLSGSGTRFKIVEAWAAGRAVVSTPIGAEGLGAAIGQHLMIADDAEKFANAVLHLLNDEPQRSQLGHVGRSLYEERFTWDAAWQSLDVEGGV